MAGDGAFPVEEFLGAITSQLDRTQDLLALKAVNRPLTYAIKDFEMELKVFVALDPEGRVTLRSAAPGEDGASSIRIAFTTITRPMIEENTVSVALSRSPTLAEAGIPDDERQRLERLGVRNTAELQRLGNSAGTAGISRLADIPQDRLRSAMSFGRPQVRDVRPLPAKGRPSGAPRDRSVPPRARPAPPQQSTRAPAPPSRPAPPAPAPPSRPARPAPAPPSRPAPPAPAPPSRPAPPAPAPPQPPRARVPGAPAGRAPAPRRPVIVPPGTRRIQLGGRNMLVGGRTPDVRLDGRSLELLDADDDRLVVDLPDGAATSGMLEIDHGEGRVDAYELSVEDPYAVDGS